MSGKLCPLLALTPNKIIDEKGETTVACIKEKCAWWIEHWTADPQTTGKAKKEIVGCAIPVMALYLSGLLHK